MSGPLKWQPDFGGNPAAQSMIKQLQGVVSATAIFAVGLPISAGSFVIGTWDFNSYDGDSGTGNLLTTDGNGLLDPIGNGALSFGPGSGSSDSGGDNSALNIFAPAGTGAGNSVGADFGISTLGFHQIQIAFDFDHPPVSDQPFYFLLSTDNGTTWSTPTALNPSGDGSWTNNVLVDLTAESGAGNNFNLRFQFLGSLSTDAVVDTVGLQLDMVQVTGEPSPVPEPTAIFMSLGLLGLAGARRWLKRN